MLAQVQLARGDASGALDSAQHALFADPDPHSIPHVQTHAILARVQEKRGLYDAARQDCLEALRTMLPLTHDTDARLLDIVDLAAGMVVRGIVPPAELLDLASVRGPLRDMPPADSLREAAAVLRGGTDGSARDANVVPARFVMVGLRERLLGPDHPSLGASLAASASSLFDELLEDHTFDAARNEEVLALLQRALPLQIAAHGPDSPLVGKTYEGIATCLVDLCRLHEATQWFARDCELWMRQPSELHDEYQIMIRARWTAWHATRAGDYELALAWTDRALERITRLVGPQHSGAALMHAGRALCLAALGQADEAVASERCAVRLLATEAVPKDQRWDCARFLGLAYLLLNRPAEARAVLEPVWQSLSIDDPRQRPFFRLEWARTMYTFHRAIGDDAQAEQFAEWIRQAGMGDITTAGLAAQP
jgi:tetratricopeptide (TPR) repeat protein